MESSLSSPTKSFNSPTKSFNHPSPHRQPGCTFYISFSNSVKILLVLSATFLLLFILLFFIMLGGAHVHVSIDNPTIVAFQVLSPNTTLSSASPDAASSSLSVLQKATGDDDDDGSSTFLLNTDVLLTMDVKNPTPDLGTYYYEALKWHLLYEGMSIASGVLPPFYQGSHAAERARQIRLQGTNVKVPPSLAFALQSNRAMLNLEAGTSFYVHLKGSLFKFGFVTHCNLTFPHAADGYLRLSKKTTCLVADQDRGHY